MQYATYELTGDPKIPAIIHWNGGQTPVWMQQLWTTGPYQNYVRANGCGHCCTAMAAQLRGIALDPHQEYELCRKLWGAPKELPNDMGQDHFLSVAGITKVLHSLDIPAECFGVPDGGQKDATEHIVEMLKQGKQVIFISDPFRDPGNIFSTGYHYVMAVGFAENGKILIANSSINGTPDGVQLVDADVIGRALFAGGTADMAMTWGEISVLYKGCTYVVVG